MTANLERLRGCPADRYRIERQGPGRLVDIFRDVWFWREGDSAHSGAACNVTTSQPDAWLVDLPQTICFPSLLTATLGNHRTGR